MDCARVDEELVGFQLAALDGATRAAVEAHLAGCARCVSSFLAVKRAIDASEDTSAPSQMVRARIRREAEQQLAAPAKSPTRSETRPRRARWVIATAAAAMLIAPLVYLAKRTPPTPTVSAPENVVPGVIPASTNKTVDTARTTPENLAFL